MVVVDIERLPWSGRTQIDEIVSDDGFTQQSRHQPAHFRTMCDSPERRPLTHRLPKKAQIRNHLETLAATRHDALNRRKRNLVHVREVRQHLFPCGQNVFRGNDASQEYVAVYT